MSKTIELSLLRSFCVVVEKRSFTKAEEIIGRTQPTISGQISAIEKLYGTTLLDRSTREIMPTESGKILYTYAKKILLLVDKSKDEIDKLRQVVKGDLIIGASTIPGTYILPDILKKFKQKYPQVNISVLISNTKDVIKKIINHTLEIGIVGEKIEDQRLQYINLAKDKIVLVVPQDHKLAKKPYTTIKELRDEKFIFREEGSGTRATIEKVLKNKGIGKFNVAIKLGSTEAVKEGIKKGLGISFISDWAIKDSGLKKVKVKDLDIERNFYMVFLKSGIKRRTTEMFIKFNESNIKNK